jgi:hypothetical protein
MHGAELTDTQWLLAYEANVKGWLPNKGGKDFVTTHKHFGPMKTAGRIVLRRGRHTASARQAGRFHGLRGCRWSRC